MKSHPKIKPMVSTQLWIYSKWILVICKVTMKAQFLFCLWTTMTRSNNKIRMHLRQSKAIMRNPKKIKAWWIDSLAHKKLPYKINKRMTTFSNSLSQEWRLTLSQSKQSLRSWMISWSPIAMMNLQIVIWNWMIIFDFY